MTGLLYMVCSNIHPGLRLDYTKCSVCQMGREKMRNFKMRLVTDWEPVNLMFFFLFTEFFTLYIFIIFIELFSLEIAKYFIV